MRLRDNHDGYDYICTHVDDFKIFAKDAEMWLNYIPVAFLVKEYGPRKYYLGNDYTFHEAQGLWTYGDKT